MLAAALVFIITLGQGVRPPPDSMGPGLDRFAGIVCGVLLVLAVSPLMEILRPAP